MSLIRPSFSRVLKLAAINDFNMIVIILAFMVRFEFIDKHLLVLAKEIKSIGMATMSVSDFLFEDDVISGQLVVERNDYTLEEAYDFIREFSSCLTDAQILIDKSRVVSLSDFVESEDL